MEDCFMYRGVPPLLRYARLRAAAGSGWLRGALSLPPRPQFVCFFSGAGAAASLRSRPAHPSPDKNLHDALQSLWR
ncbi:MAG: hypothetical protein NZM35_12250 [Chitinophagales bacterium]|nr:hypothetical protein [Chitinophagales bacterium]MDW8420186.1 hypothetical protein [Chitinophagales bacterium]